MKVCSTCKTEKPLTEFGRNTNRPDGLDNCCRDCRREIRRRYKERHPQRVKESQAKYQAKHKEDKRDYDKQYREANKETIQQRKRAYYQEHKDSERARVENWKTEHPEQYRAVHSAAKHRYRAQLLENGGSYTHEQLLECLEFFGYCCAYSGEPLQPDYHVDHVVPISKGGRNDIKNIVPANPVPNIKKKDKDWVDWFFNSEYFSEERYKKIIEWLEQ